MKIENDYHWLIPTKPLLNWKDWSRGTIQDLTARLGLSVRISPMLFQKITSIDLSYEVLLN